MLQYGPKGKHNISTIRLKGSGNEQRNSRTFSILFLVIGSLTLFSIMPPPPTGFSYAALKLFAVGR